MEGERRRGVETPPVFLADEYLGVKCRSQFVVLQKRSEKKLDTSVLQRLAWR